MPSFDVVSKTDLMEIDNVINQVQRSIKQRFDLAGTKCDVQRSDNTLTITADDNMKLTQLHSLIKENCVKRKIDTKALDFSEPKSASGDSLRQSLTIKQGIDKEIAKDITKSVKGTKLKIQIAIQGDELRVTGKKRDHLQETMTLIKGAKIERPLQYVNFRD